MGWEGFKEKILWLYPGSMDDRRILIANLDKFIAKSASAQYETAEMLGEYYREFTRMSEFLILRNRLSIREQSEKFYEGLGTKLEQQTRFCLSMVFITRHPDEPDTMDEIFKEASILVSGGA